MQAPRIILDAANGKDVMVFDGVCNLCSGWVQFVVRRDPDARFLFLTAQSNLGEALYAELGLKSADYDSFIVIKKGRVFTSLDGVIAVCAALGPLWSLARILGFLPRPIKDAIYSLVARNRYRVFGKLDTCMVPTPHLRARFLDEV
ncbi:MAG: DCC1-like thiol-disulfide oxidoreductase family protein [Pseudomonadota bacterium]